MKPDNIHRPLYVDRILSFLNKPLIKVLTGQRRVGKSYILLQLIEKIKELFPGSHIIYINIELYEFSKLKDYHELYRYISSKLRPGKDNFLLIDEIQEVTSFELCLRSLLAESQCDIIITGSNARMLSGELATVLSGRYIQIPVYSLSYREFLAFHSIQDSNNSLNSYLRYGGMPYLRNTGLQEDVVFEYLRNVNSTILLKDVVSRGNIRNVSLLENLVAFLADNTGNLMSALNISKYLKSQQQQVPVQTILNYLKALANAYFIHKVPRAEINGLKIFEIGEKYYFEDLGLRNVIRSAAFKSEINKLMENIVYLELRRNNFQVFIGKSGDKEIDFIAEKNGERKYFQVTYMLYDQQTIDREFGNLLSVDDNYPKYVITLDELAGLKEYKGIQRIHLREFLLSESVNG